MAIITETKTFTPSGWDESKSVFRDTTNTNTFNNFIGKDSDSGSYGQWYLTTGSQAESMLFVDFDFSSIPANATIKSITGKAKVYGSGSTSYVKAKQISGYANNEVIGTATTYGTSLTPVDLNFGSNVTREDLENMQLRIYSKRGTSSTTSNFYARFYGAEIIITYSYDDSAGSNQKIYVKDNGVWKQYSKVFKKVNGSWIEQEDFSNLFDAETKYIRIDENG